MLICSLYAFNLLLLLVGTLSFRLRTPEKQYALALLRPLAGIPLLLLEYIYLIQYPEMSVFKLVVFSETVFAILWMTMVFRLHQAISGTDSDRARYSLSEGILSSVLILTSAYLAMNPPTIENADDILTFGLGGVAYFAALFVTLSMLSAAWRLEAFWQILPPVSRWEYKSLVVGSYVVCGAMIWTASYRLTYLRVLPNHLILLSLILVLAWALLLYAVARHRLLNRKMFVSRKVIYSFVAPTILGIYLFSLGLASLLMRTFDWSLSDTIFYMFVVLGLVAIGLFMLSGKLRRRVHFFISTHFYVNKYEYRDEWLALTGLLQGAFTELEITRALAQVMADSLYTTNIMIWLGDEENGYRLVVHDEEKKALGVQTYLKPEDPLLLYFKGHNHFYMEGQENDQERNELIYHRGEFLRGLDLVLLTPLLAGKHLIGLVGIGPEFTGGKYGKDDFDLLIALGTQTASRFFAVRMAEELSMVRQREIWENLSHFVLHDLKNSATMLSLLRQNADDHLQDPEFQQDMLEAIDNALRRMNRVQERLTMLTHEITPVWQEFQCSDFLRRFSEEMTKKLPGLRIFPECPQDLKMFSDPDLLSQILENLMINAFEAGGIGTEISLHISSHNSKEVSIEVIDNGPGIAQELLPDALFEPFKTTKPKGSGVGLWQARRLAERIGGVMFAANRPDGGAQFLLHLTTTGGAKEMGEELGEPR